MCLNWPASTGFPSTQYTWLNVHDGHNILYRTQCSENNSHLEFTAAFRVYIVWNSLLQYSCSCYHVEDITELKECRSHPHTFTRRIQLFHVRHRYVAHTFPLFIIIMLVKELCWLFFHSLHVSKMSLAVTVTHSREQVFLTAKNKLYLRYRGQAVTQWLNRRVVGSITVSCPWLKRIIESKCWATTARSSCWLELEGSV